MKKRKGLLSKETEAKLRKLFKERFESQRKDQEKIKRDIERIKKTNPEEISENVANTFFAKDLELAIAEVKASRKGKRERISKEEKAFFKWVGDKQIDLSKYSVNKLEIEIEVAYQKEQIPFKLSHGTLGDYLREWKQKNRPR